MIVVAKLLKVHFYFLYNIAIIFVFYPLMYLNDIFKDMKVIYTYTSKYECQEQMDLK